jgi:hypothetical protein
MHVIDILLTFEFSMTFLIGSITFSDERRKRNPASNRIRKRCFIKSDSRIFPAVFEKKFEASPKELSLVQDNSATINGPVRNFIDRR